MKVIGIDLAGVESRPTGFCVLDEHLITKTKVLFTDEEIIEEVESVTPDLISIDAPLALPKGRKSIDDKNGPHFRECDKELARMGIKFFPVTLGPMRKLTERGMKLRKVFERKGFKVIESFPGAVQDVLGMPRKQKGLEKLRKALIAYGLKGDVATAKSDHELDAATSALVGKLYLDGEYTAIGDPKEILMILPKLQKE